MSYQELFDFLQHVGKDPSRLVFEDELTGIQNRRFLLSYLEHKVRWDQDADFPLALAIIDIDHFKEINDTHGHEAGDQALAWFAEILKREAGRCRFSGPVRRRRVRLVLAGLQSRRSESQSRQPPREDSSAEVPITGDGVRALPDSEHRRCLGSQ